MHTHDIRHTAHVARYTLHYTTPHPSIPFPVFLAPFVTILILALILSAPVQKPHTRIIIVLAYIIFILFLLLPLLCGVFTRVIGLSSGDISSSSS